MVGPVAWFLPRYALVFLGSFRIPRNSYLCGATSYSLSQRMVDITAYMCCSGLFRFPKRPRCSLRLWFFSYLPESWGETRKLPYIGYRRTCPSSHKKVIFIISEFKTKSLPWIYKCLVPCSFFSIYCHAHIAQRSLFLQACIYDRNLSYLFANR